MKKHSPWLILITVAVGTVLVGLDRTVVNLAVPSIITAFHVSIATADWIATAYLLTNAIAIPIFGKLSDAYGARRVYEVGFVFFIIISGLTALSPSIWWLIGLRALQGLAGASIYPSAMTLIARNFTDKEKRAEAMGIWTSFVTGSIVLGPLIAGPLLDHYSWPSVFYINIPIGVVGFIMIRTFLPANESGQRQRFDYLGTVLLSFFLVGLLLGLNFGGTWGWLAPVTLATWLVTIVSAGLFLLRERKVDYALINPRHGRNKTLMSVLAVSFITFGSLSAFMFLLAIFTQDTLHLNATQSGYLFLPLLIAMSIVSPFGGRLSKRFSARYVIMTGIALSALGMVGVAYLSSGLVMLLLPLAAIGIGFGLLSSPVTTATTTSVPMDEVGMASGLLNLVRNISGVFGIAIFGLLLATGVSYKSIFLVSAVVMAVGIVLALAVREPAADYVPESIHLEL